MDKNSNKYIVPYVDLARQYKSIQNRVEPVWKKILKSGQYLKNTHTQKLEQSLAKYINCKFAHTVASGTDALLISLLAVGIKKDDEVITPSFTFVSSATSIERVGAKPVFIDINEQNYCIDTNKIENMITSKTKAILPTHLFGQACDMEHINSIAKKNNLTVIEDACQAFGAKSNGKKVGSIGDISTLSFYPTKNLSSFSDGGAVLTNNQKFYEMTKKLSDYGFSQRYISHFHGFNSRIDELQAAWLLSLLKIQNRLINRRRQLAKKYINALKKLPIILPSISDFNSHVFNVFAIRTEKREQLSQFLKKNGIATLVHYPLPIHKQPAFRNFNKLSLPQSELVSKQILSLPIFPQMTDKQQNYVIKNIYNFFNK